MVLFKTKTFTLISPRLGNSYLARSIALRSLFAQSTIRGSTRATLQLRSIWKIEDKCENTMLQPYKTTQKIIEHISLPFLCSYLQTLQLQAQ